MLMTKEYYDVMKQFEMDFKGKFRLDKEDKSLWSKGIVYQHGDANNMFDAYLRGYSLGKVS